MPTNESHVCNFFVQKVFFSIQSPKRFQRSRFQSDRVASILFADDEFWELLVTETTRRLLKQGGSVRRASYSCTKQCEYREILITFVGTYVPT
jgi:hypothetical protein